MDMEWSESRFEHAEKDDRDVTPIRDIREGGAHDDLELNGTDKSSKHRSRKKSSGGEEKDHRSKDRDRSKKNNDDILKEVEKDAKDSEKHRVSSRERRGEDRDEREKERSRDSKVREKDYDREKHKEKEHEREKDRRDRGKEKDREREREAEKDSDRGRDKEKGREKNRDRDKEREKERERAKEKEREKERDKHKDREKERENYKDIDRERGKEKIREKEKEADPSKEKSRDRDRLSGKSPHEEYNDRSKNATTRDDKVKRDHEDDMDTDSTKQGKVLHTEGEENSERPSGGVQPSGSELEERIRNMKEDRLKKKPEDVSEVLSWVNKSRKIEEKKKAERKKALQLSKIFEEQDNVDEEESDEEAGRHTTKDLAGVKVLHGLEKVMEGGAVVLTLKDQNVLADGDVNEEVDMLENIEIGEQKRRDDAYKAAKKKTGIYDDKFNDEPGSEKKILPQYDDPAADEGITLDESGRFNSEAEKKLEELRRRLQGTSTNNRFEDLNTSEKISHDYFTQEEMLKFKKPKKKKSLRKKDKLDINALEAEAISAGLGAGDLGSRNDSKRQSIKEEQERSEAERRNNAYQLAYAKADEASKSLQLEQTLSLKLEEDDTSFIADDDEDLRKSLERARKLALKKQEDAPSGPQGIALIATATASSQTVEDKNLTTGESEENKVVFTEMEEFVWGLQLDEEARKPDEEDVFMDEDEAPIVSDDKDRKEEAGGWSEVKETVTEEPKTEDTEEIVPDETIHEVAVGKGLSGALRLLKDRGTLKEGIEWGGRNMDKKKSKLVGIVDEGNPKESKSKDNRISSLVDYTKEIHIERTDEFGRILTPKESFRQISHKFHGKGPGKMKQEKRMKQYQEELKLKQMKNSDTPSLSVERMREAQAQLKTPYLVLSGHVKPGQSSDPRSGFATVEKDLPGGLTPMLGDRKVEHFLGIKRKAGANSGIPKKPRA